MNEHVGHLNLLRGVCRWGPLALVLSAAAALALGAPVPAILLGALLAICVLICAFLLWLSHLTQVAIDSAVDAAVVPDGAQERRVVVHHGYHPNVVRVEAGRPVRLLFDRREAGECSAWVVFPELGLARELAPHDVTGVEFVPERPGSLGFSCKHGVCRGTLRVMAARSIHRIAVTSGRAG